MKLQNAHTHIIFKNLKAAKGTSEGEKKNRGKRREKMKEKDKLCKGQQLS